MIKNVLALIGLVLVLALGVTYHYGYLSKKLNEVSTQIDRDTAVARAEARILDVERRAEQIGDKARKLRIDARVRELGQARDAESLEKTETALKNLAGAMKSAGLPKPSALSPDDLKKTISFAGKALTGQDALKLLNAWQDQATKKKRVDEVQTRIVVSMKQAADNLESQRDKLLSLATEVRNKLDEMTLQKDLAQVETQIAELKANTTGNYTGDLGDALKSIQKEIDEKLATVEVLGQESAAQELSDPESAAAIVQAASSKATDLDKLFE